MAKVNFSEKDLSSSEYLPEGENICVISKVLDTVSKENRTPMVEVTFADSMGRAERENFPLTERALFKLARLAKACGFTQPGFNTDLLRGKKVKVLKEFKGMRTIQTQDGAKEVKDYQLSFGPAPKVSTANDADAPVGGEGEYSMDDIPF